MSSGRVRTPLAMPVPVVLVVGGSEGFIQRCRVATAGAHTLIRAADDPAQAAALAQDWRPLVLLVVRGARIDASAERRLRDLGASISASVVTVGDESSPTEELHRLLDSALLEADLLRDPEQREPLL